jgi:DNA-binding NtrC family response regulator
VTRILVVDDEPKLGRVLVEVLEGRGWDVERVGGGREALVRIGRGGVDIVITDLRMPEVDGLSVLRETRRLAPAADVVVMTAYATAAGAVEAMKEGAVDYLIKPFAIDEFRLRIERLAAKRELSARADALARRLDRAEGFAGIVAESEKMKAVVTAARRVAATDETVLLLGESGTGKTRLARAIHNASRRADGPFLEVHCAALPETLLESELYGREKGAFTGANESKAGHVEAAAGGTLFLDEIGEIPPAAQVKLLRFLQDRTFTRLGSTQARSADVRVVAATNRDLLAAIREGAFREDLYYRLNVFPIVLPPLRERPEDVRAIVLEILAQRGLGPDRLAPEALAALERHPLPGNVRELENALARALILAGASPIVPEHLPPALRGGAAPAPLDDLLVPGFSLDRLERELIQQAIAKAGGNKTAAARLLGITRRRLYSRLASIEADGDADDEG